MEPIRRLTDCEAGYVAGVVDGEGTITLTRTHRGEHRRPIVSISSTELPLLIAMRERNVERGGQAHGSARPDGNA